MDFLSTIIRVPDIGFLQMHEICQNRAMLSSKSASLKNWISSGISKKKRHAEKLLLFLIDLFGTINFIETFCFYNEVILGPIFWFTYNCHPILIFSCFGF